MFYLAMSKASKEHTQGASSIGERSPDDQPARGRERRATYVIATAHSSYFPASPGRECTDVDVCMTSCPTFTSPLQPVRQSLHRGTLSLGRPTLPPNNEGIGSGRGDSFVINNMQSFSSNRNKEVKKERFFNDAFPVLVLFLVG